ncbi:MAG: DoxX family protein [Roseofilum sp. SBFL]|uniref:DoxX family protein n=1 Tax=unclassified Roseofilum TaxID=2620099 RepID=UPI001B0D8727|nr:MULTISPECIES: DoxX family protein [unclassified Roseofilum]MBP0013084.1 DoxX family protein [Roseofilum sp. SID3]MBP0023748.1 DoxX family protein [Roseofilum sp. SID2]MBP0036820.1 DoxX family protein [Roseofilum sp. SID1]MBP0042610.1 DoxX family protein [Roseofilum sp. SBFL]
MEKMENFSLLAGRAFLVAIFLRSGIQKILGFSGTASVIASKGIPVPEFFLIFAILFELIGAISILVGYKSRWGALLLMIFLIPTTFDKYCDFYRNLFSDVRSYEAFKELHENSGIRF